MREKYVLRIDTACRIPELRLETGKKREVFMPYINEFAQYNTIQRISENSRIKEMLSRYQLLAAPARDTSSVNYKLVSIDQISMDCLVTLPEYVLSIDGSYAEIPIDNGFASAKIGYTTISDVLLHLSKLKDMDLHRPLDPRELRKTHISGAADTVLAGCNVTFDGEIDPQSSFRRGVIDLFREQRAFADGETLLETYEALLAYKPPVPAQSCPYLEFCGHENPKQALPRKSGTFSCDCAMKFSCHSTDALRFHERFNPLGENGTAFGEVIHVTERLWLIHAIRALEQRKMFDVLARLAIIIDGPLAVFGRPGWLSRAISRELQRINKILRQETGKDLLVIGVEKTGVFVEHLAKLCRESETEKRLFNFQKGTALLPTDEYIRKFVVYSNNIHQYGDVTYFGRKLFYHSKSGAQIVATLPFLKPDHRNLNNVEIDRFPRLADVLGLFEAIGSSRYRNGLIPVSLAHAGASIPRRMGSRVLEELAANFIQSPAD